MQYTNPKIVTSVRIARVAQELFNMMGETNDWNAQTGQWKFIASHNEYLRIFKSILDFFEIDKKQDLILDLGCGVSPILIYAFLEEYEKLAGVDTEQRYLNFLQKYITDSRLTVQAGLMQNADKLIKKAKVIYLYMPIKDEELYDKALKQIWKKMKKGTIIMDFYGPIRIALPKEQSVHKLHPQCNLQGLETSVFIK